MSDLPQDLPTANTSSANIPAPPTISMGGKEGEVIGIAPQELPLKPVGGEINLPKEVASAGVSVTPQTIVLPQPVSQAGVQAVGAHAPLQPTQASTMHLPLTDEQIAKGLHESLKSSVRWLSEWCVRQLKIVHGAVTKN
jgi:hypothetical protein